MVKVECAVEAKNYLGEGAIWDPVEGLLYWVDMLDKQVWSFNPRSGATRTWQLPKIVGAFVLRENGGGVLTMEDGFYFLDMESGESELIVKVDAEIENSIFNDGKADRRGRFFAGGEDQKTEAPICGLFRLDADLSLHELERGIICNNGPCWSPDNKTFYHTDSFRQEMYAYDYDIESGDISNKRLFMSCQDEPGIFDGSTIDEEGYLWNAQIIAGELVRYTPDGEVERRIPIPCKTITSVSFGGDNLDVIYLTSMGNTDFLGPEGVRLFGEAAKPQPHGGGIFAVTGTGVRGIPEPRFAG
ncbi:MAG: SMP-30/gluconolactonase/LRE family protein [Rhodospirillaceae bacterium]|jgi:L-arabinonolactonase|nr:SMP-30/gluconolactonase/LRE family protein [Rhodospirillaceae bacterium]MBT7293757.1 SMP-30/gluconolactonase/LRE family protein [Rhodospirillaceae bacterium]